jgi:hypothetical protein
MQTFYKKQQRYLNIFRTVHPDLLLIYNVQKCFDRAGAPYRHVFEQCISVSVPSRYIKSHSRKKHSSSDTSGIFSDSVFLILIFANTNSLHTDPLTGSSSSSSNTLGIFSDSVSLIEMFFFNSVHGPVDRQQQQHLRPISDSVSLIDMFFNSVHGPVDRKQQQRRHLTHIFGQCIPD